MGGRSALLAGEMATRPWKSKLLGYSFYHKKGEQGLRIAESSIKKYKTKVREITSGSRPIAMYKRYDMLAILQRALNNSFLRKEGYLSLKRQVPFQLFYSNGPPYTEPYVRWLEGTAQELILRLPLNLLLDNLFRLCPSVRFFDRQVVDSRRQCGNRKLA